MDFTRRRLLGTAAMGAGILLLPVGGAKAQNLGPMPVNGRFDNVTVRISAIAGVYAYGFQKFEDQIRDELGISMEFDNVPPQDAYARDMLEFRSQRSSHDIKLFMPANIADYHRFLVPIRDISAELGLELHGDDVEPIYRDIYTTWNGVQYSVPWDGDQHNLFYNVAAFENEQNRSDFESAYGYPLTPPRTWAQYRDVAEFMNGRDWNGDGEPEYGVAEAWQRGGFSVWWFTNKFASMGGIWFDNDMNPLINSPSGVNALQNTLDIREFTPPGTSNFGYPELEAALLNEQVPMVIQWSSTGKSAQDESISSIVGNVGVAMVPGMELADGTITSRPALPTGWAGGIPEFSDRKAAAAALLAFISHPDRALEIALDPGTAVDPWRASSFEATDRWREAFPADPDYGEDFINVQRQTVQTGMPDLQIPGSNQYLNALDEQISAAIAGQVTAQEAMDAAAARWVEITDELGRDGQLAAWRYQATSMREMVGIEYEPSWAG
jgi:multiple sugar transport system substrate-binding protein